MNQINFDQQNLGQTLSQLSSEQFNMLEFGVIGFDVECIVKVYNANESKMTGLSYENVLDADLFSTVAPCMNNFLVAQKFIDAMDEKVELDEIIDFVLTLKMKPTRVKLRLISSPNLPYNYVIVLRPN